MTFSPSTDLPPDVTPWELDFVARVASQVEKRGGVVDFVIRLPSKTWGPSTPGDLRISISRPTSDHPKADLRVVGDGWATLDGKETPMAPPDVVRMLFGRRPSEGASSTPPEILRVLLGKRWEGRTPEDSPAAPKSSTVTAAVVETSSEPGTAIASSPTDPATPGPDSNTSDARACAIALPTSGKRCSD